MPVSEAEAGGVIPAESRPLGTRYNPAPLPASRISPFLRPYAASSGAEPGEAFNRAYFLSADGTQKYVAYATKTYRAVAVGCSFAWELKISRVFTPDEIAALMKRGVSGFQAEPIRTKTIPARRGYVRRTAFAELDSMYRALLAEGAFEAKREDKEGTPKP